MADYAKDGVNQGPNDPDLIKRVKAYLAGSPILTAEAVRRLGGGKADVAALREALAGEL